MKKSDTLKCPRHGRAPCVSGIYVIVAPGGETYVGATANCHRRWTQHTDKLKNGTHHSPLLQAAANRYGEATLVFEVVEQLPEAEMNAAEQRWIDKFKADGRRMLNTRSADGFMTRGACGHDIDNIRSLTFMTASAAESYGFDWKAIQAACRGMIGQRKGRGGSSVYKRLTWRFVDA